MCHELTGKEKEKNFIMAPFIRVQSALAEGQIFGSRALHAPFIRKVPAHYLAGQSAGNTQQLQPLALYMQ